MNPLTQFKKIVIAPVVIALALVALAAFVVVPAFATPPSGIVSGTILARGSFVDPTDLKFKIKGSTRQETLQVNNTQETVVQQIIIAPGGQTGWHSHPGPAVALVTSGQLSLYDGEDPTCTARTYSAGEAFIDSGQGHVHLARNEGTTNVEVWVTYFDVPPGGSVRTDQADPGNCPF